MAPVRLQADERVASHHAIGQEQEQKQSTLDKKDTRVEPTSWGKVAGHVYDAVTGAPILGASISGYTDEGFLDKGRSVGQTDEVGSYEVQLILGRISHNLDVGRALLSSGIGLLLGSATNTTKRIDVSRVGLRVTATGYKTFEGVVIARWVDAKQFRINLQPILLVPSGSVGASVAANSWNAVRFESAEIMPPIAQKGQKVDIVATVRVFRKDVAKGMEMAAFSPLWKGAKKLRQEGDVLADGTLRFSGDYKVSGREKRRANEVEFAILKAPVDFDPERSRRIALIQIADGDVQKAEATRREAGLKSFLSGKYVESIESLSGLAGASDPEPVDCQIFAAAATRQGRYAEAVEPLHKLWLNAPSSLLALEDYVTGLYRADRYDEVSATVSNAIKDIKPKELGKHSTSATLGFYGLALVKKRDLTGAQKVNESLLDIQASGLAQSVIDFRGSLRLAEVEKEHAADPSSAAALADYGRALLDLGRIEEAVAKLSQAATVDPAQPAIQRDLAWAALQMKKGDPPIVDLSKAVEDAKVGLNLDKGKQKSKDFFSWNQYGILLFALAEQQRTANDVKWTETSDAAIEALREALTLGRVGARRNSGFFSYQLGYTSGSEVAISGFAYPQANSTFALLDSLKKLRKNGTDRIALFNATAALYDLGQTLLASRYAEQLAVAEPENPEVAFLRSLIANRKGDSDGAEKLLRQVLDAAPNHPRANLVLADLLADAGDVPGSAERLAAHAKFYGEAVRK